MLKTSTDEVRRTTVRPGALTALLGELAHAPDATGWTVPLVPGEVIGGRFEIVREIGRGGFGVVYEARDGELGRSVAFKAIRAGCCDEVRAQRTLAEAEAAARLAHPNIVHLYDVGRSERGAFLIMELLHGESLHDRLARGPPLKPREAVAVAVEISRGLAHAHDQGVVHRDLKPGNVFLCDDGHARVLDFGLAHVFERRGPEGGTPEYMAPEQARGEPSDERADVYALGVILHELLTGSRPASPLSPRQRGERVRVRGAFSKLLSQMLAQDPAERPANAAQVHAQLASIQKSLQPRHLLWAAWAVAALALVAAAAFAVRARPLPPGRLLAAMPDTVNTTGDPDLDAVGELLRSGLEQSRRLSLMARSRLLNLLRDPSGSAPRILDEELAGAAARRGQAQLLIVPAVRRMGDGFDLSVRAVDLARGEPAFVVHESAPGKGSVPEALDRLVTSIRRALREGSGDAAQPRVALAEIAPIHPEALRHYAEARRLDSDGDVEASVEADERAVAADPDFPLPHVYLTFRYEARDFARVRRHIDAARRNLHRLPPKQRVLVDALASVHDDGTQSEMLRHLARAIEGWPEDPEAYQWMVNTLIGTRADVVAARPYIEKALAVAALPEGVRVDYLLYLGRLDEALAAARRWTERTPGWLSYLNLALVHRHRGEDALALDAARRSLSFESPPPRPRRSLLLTFANGGALDELEDDFENEVVAVTPLDPSSRREWLMLQGRWREVLRRHDAQSPTAGSPATAHEIFHRIRADLLAFSGAHPDAVWREVLAQFRAGAGGEVLYGNAIHLALLGDLDRAERLMSGWWFPDHCATARLHRYLQAWKRGQREEALRGLASLYGRDADFHRGQILQELGRDREAVEAFRAYRRGEVFAFRFGPMFAFLPRSMVLEAVSLDRLGERDEARRLLALVLRLWRRADPDGPFVREARALAARLEVARSP